MNGVMVSVVKTHEPAPRRGGTPGDEKKKGDHAPVHHIISASIVPCEFIVRPITT
jgi:hypothetical protein